ncbi:MAG: alpha/beta hydrolase [Cytophagales bacterium]|nr:alpha/beta hydrolase [Cytophagales bacterium]
MKIFNLVLLGIGLIYFASACSTTKRFLDAGGNIVEISIASMEKVEIGGVKQALLIRGNNINNPVLLFLHGGPGTPYDGLAYRFQAKLEERFVVVHWDQRGSGKSYNWSTPKKSITAEQTLKDAHELMLYLIKRFNKQKLYLVGHSWGSYMGMYLVKRHPELLHAYIGAGQGVDMLEQEKFSHRFVVEEAQKRGDKKALKRLEKLGEPPYKNPIKGFAVKYPILTRYGGFLYGQTTQSKFFKSILKSPEYGFFRWVQYGFGVFYHYKNLLKNEGDKLWEYAPAKTVRKVEVPVYFIQGKHDGVSPGNLLDKYYNELEAPHKELIVLQNSGHFTFLKEPEVFCDVIIKVLNE